MLEPTDSIKTTNGYANIVSIEKEHLKTPQRVYNFNVLCYHTYVVGESYIVVHNENCHGNSLNCDKENKLYYLVDEQKNIHKIGETTRGLRRYSQVGLERKGLKMEFIQSGSKREIHILQHTQLIEFYNKYGKLPTLNKCFW